MFSLHVSVCLSVSSERVFPRCRTLISASSYSLSLFPLLLASRRSSPHASRYLPRTHPPFDALHSNGLFVRLVQRVCCVRRTERGEDGVVELFRGIRSISTNKISNIDLVGSQYPNFLRESDREKRQISRTDSTYLLCNCCNLTQPSATLSPCFPRPHRSEGDLFSNISSREIDGAPSLLRSAPRCGSTYGNFDTKREMLRPDPGNLAHNFAYL